MTSTKPPRLLACQSRRFDAIAERVCLPTTSKFEGPSAIRLRIYSALSSEQGGCGNGRHAHRTQHENHPAARAVHTRSDGGVACVQAEQPNLGTLVAGERRG